MQELYPLLPVVGIFLVFWLLVIRPAARRSKEVRAVQSSLDVGDKVVTNAGIFGTIARLEEDRVGLEIAEGVVIEVARPAIMAVSVPAAPDEPAVAEADAPVEREGE